MSLGWGLFLIGLSVILNAFFAGIETGFTSARAVRLMHRAKRGDRGAALAEKILRHRENAIVAAVVGNNVAVVGGTAVATYTFVAWLGTSGETVAAIVMSVLNIVFGEILPKTFYRAHPERSVSLSAPVFRTLSWLLWPLQWVALFLARGILWVLRARGPQQHSTYTRRHLLSTFAMSLEQEELDSHQDTLLQQFIENSRHAVRTVMTPKSRVASVEAGARTREVIDLVRRTGHSRILVDDVEGEFDSLVLFRDLVHHRPEDPLATALREVVRVSAWMGIDEAIGVLNDARVSLAVVVDHLGRSLGIVTLEDLLEPLVGEILDEHDSPG